MQKCSHWHTDQDPSLPPTNDVWGKVMFLHLFVCPRIGGGSLYVICCLAAWSHVPSGGFLSGGGHLCQEGASVKGGGLSERGVSVKGDKNHRNDI